MLSLCCGWEFTPEWSEEFLLGHGSFASVRLPHTVKELSLHYADRTEYEMVSGYRRMLSVPKQLDGKRLFLQFDGAAHIATVFVNGVETITHKSGYTAFRVEITSLVHPGDDNLIAVRLDSTENPSVPPFGFVIDYLTFGGLYREVWLDIREETFIEDIFVTTPYLGTAHVAVTFSSGQPQECSARILDMEGNVVGASGWACTGELNVRVENAKEWNPDSPNLYVCEVLLRNGDAVRSTFGFRTIEFKTNTLLINNKPIFLRGLNRHQCYPYIGYAAPERLQREDARILKYELQCNAVRTSHYPQSQHFIDECDRLGLLVFTEIPGWQHIGDEAWKDVACENVREMVLQYRNHPSIILWGVRINESQDDDAFYTRTNQIAHELDNSRPTTGVRYLEKSSLLEDVYAFNDFSHVGTNPGAKPKDKVSPDQTKPLFISECNGHMFPTKPFDNWERRQEHALRHARVHDAAMADGTHVGAFGWCMFDYQTHKDFGSGDRICYHGVLDAFRNPKLAAAAYASQGDLSPVLEIGCSMDIGDYNAGQTGNIYAFTNADHVRLYKNGNFVSEFGPSAEWKGLKHGPVLIDDTIGQLLESQEGFDSKKAAYLRDCLTAAGKYGLSNMPLSAKLKLGLAMLKYHMTFEDGYNLYGKYVGNWGGESTVWRFDAEKDGKVVRSVTCCPSSKLHLEVIAGSSSLCEGSAYDMTSVRIRILDENGRTAVYAQYPLTFTVSGAAELAGPAVITAEGGMGGTYIRTIGYTGAAELTVSAPGLEDVTIHFEIGG